MRYLIMVVCLASGAGCLTEADRRDWEEAKREMRGDNIEMGSAEGAFKNAALKPLR